MCGLAGVLLQPGARPAAAWQEIRRLFTATLVANEERGRDAAGAAVIQRDGAFRLFKQPVAASELVEMTPYQELLDLVGPETTCLLGHARWPTKGSPAHNANNHPLLVGHTLGIHNGLIANDDELFAALGLARQAEVDSEIIFRLLDNVHPTRHNSHYLPQVKDALRLLQGTFATLSVDLRRPTRLLALKYNNPLCLHYEPALQALWFSSRYLFLRQAFGRSVSTEALGPGYAYLFEADHLSRHGQRPVGAVSLRLPDETDGRSWSHNEPGGGSGNA